MFKLLHPGHLPVSQPTLMSMLWLAIMTPEPRVLAQHATGLLAIRSRYVILNIARYVPFEVASDLVHRLMYAYCRFRI